MLIDPRRQKGQMLGRSLDPLDGQDGGALPSAFGFVPLDLKVPAAKNPELLTKLAASSPAKMRQGAGALPKTTTAPADGGRFIKSPAGPRMSIPGTGEVFKPGTVWTPGVQVPIAPVAAPGASTVPNGEPAATETASSTSTIAIALAIVAVAWFASR